MTEPGLFSTVGPVLWTIAGQIRLYEPALWLSDGAATCRQVVHHLVSLLPEIAQHRGHLEKAEPEALARSGYVLGRHGLRQTLPPTLRVATICPC